MVIRFRLKEGLGYKKKCPSGHIYTFFKRNETQCRCSLDEEALLKDDKLEVVEIPPVELAVEPSYKIEKVNDDFSINVSFPPQKKKRARKKY